MDLQQGGEPFFGFWNRVIGAFRPIFKLVAADFRDGEVFRLRVGEVEAGNGSGRGHGEVLGEIDAGVGLGIEQFEQGALDGMVGAGRIAGGRADALVFFVDQRRQVETLVPAVAQSSLRTRSCSHSAAASARRSASDLSMIAR